MSFVINCYDSGAQQNSVMPSSIQNANQRSQQVAQPAKEHKQEEAPGIGGIFNSLIKNIDVGKIFDGVKSLFGGKGEAALPMEEGEGLEMIPELEEAIPEIGEIGEIGEIAELLPELAFI